MVEYLKTKKGYFYKFKKNGKKKRVSQKEYNKKNKTRKNIKMIGGILSELDSLDVSIKTIILMGECHTDKKNMSEYRNIIRKQKEIVNLVVDKFGLDKTYFYSEAPQDARELVLKTDNYSSCVIVQYAKETQIPIKLSSITACHRVHGGCNEEYSRDILSIFNDNSNINCIIVAIGLLHIPELKGFIGSIRPDIRIIIVNTVSNRQLTPLIPEITEKHPSVIDLLKIELPYDLPDLPLALDFSGFAAPVPPARPVAFARLASAARPVRPGPTEQFIVEVLYNETSEKIYKCPLCGSITGTAAPKNPTDTSLFTHNYSCANKGKNPIEPI
jgi:hypothetical protein